MFVLFGPGLARYADAKFENVDFARRSADVEVLKERLRAMPGIELVTEGGAPLAAALGESDRRPTVSIAAGGRVHSVQAVTLNGGARYCTAIGARFIAGRDLEQGDFQAGAPPVAILSESLARQLAEGGAGVGMRFSLTRQAQAPRPAATQKSAAAAPSGQEYEVVGVVADSIRYGVRGERAHTIYLPDIRNPDPASDVSRPFVGLVVSTTGSAGRLAASVESAVREVFPETTALQTSTIGLIVDQQMAAERMAARLFGWFSLVALALCMAGTWGLVARAMADRTHELGVRLAVGASPRSLVTMMMRAGVVPVAAGCVAGFGLAAAASRLIDSYMFGIEAFYLPIFVAAAFALLLMAALASLVPSRRVLRLDAVQVLRSE